MPDSSRRALSLAACVWGLVACASGETVKTGSAGLGETSGQDTTGTDEGPVSLTTSISAGETDAETSIGTSADGSDTDGLDDTGAQEDTGSNDTGGLDDTGGESDDGYVAVGPGQADHQIVSAGTQATSESYIMIFTLGQPTKLPISQTSENHAMRGGLIGANGSPP
jgi:hypothetical protein